MAALPTDFVLPDYGGATLANLLPSISAKLAGRNPVIDLPNASRYVLLLVDGLGWGALSDHAGHAERLASHLPDASVLTCSVPSTTATSLTTLGCGVPPGKHGVMGYTFLDPDADQVLNALSWEGGPEDVEGFRLSPTAFEALAAKGSGSGTVSLARFEDSALTRLAFDGTQKFGVELESDQEQVCGLVGKALETCEVVYCYERQLDHTGHGSGVGSWQWLERLALVDDLVGELAASLNDDVCLLVTGDHGMVNIPEEHRVVAEEHPELRGFRHIAGEGRFRQLYTDEPERLARAWQDFLGERAHVVTRDRALAEGWFGPLVDPAARERIGDVLVAMREDWAVMSTTFPGESSLVGMHGSLTRDEMQVPLFALGPSR